MRYFYCWTYIENEESKYVIDTTNSENVENISGKREVVIVNTNLIDPHEENNSILNMINKNTKQIVIWFIYLILLYHDIVLVKIYQKNIITKRTLLSPN